MLICGKGDRRWTSGRLTVIYNGSWLVYRSVRGYQGLGTTWTERFEEPDGLLNYLTAEERQRLGLTPLVILSLVTGEQDEL